MKVCVEGGMELQGLVRHVGREGDELVARDRAELVLTEDAKYVSSTQRVVGFGLNIPLLALRAGGLEVESGAPHDEYFLSRWYERGWGEQVVVGVPLGTLMDEDCSVACEQGCALRFVESARSRAIFEHPLVERVMQELGHVGFVTVVYGRGGGITRLCTGVPYGGLFALLECVKGKISAWFSEPWRLLESWVCALKITRYPFPHAPSAEQVEVVTSSEMEKHLWMPQVEEVRKILTTRSTILGWATAWHQSLEQAGWRVLRTARNLGFARKQFRTDLVPKAKATYGMLTTGGVL